MSPHFCCRQSKQLMILALWWICTVLACTPENCSACSDDECISEPACFFQRSSTEGMYSCMPCKESFPCEAGEVAASPARILQTQVIDRTLGCSGSANMEVALMMGVLAGMLTCILPCGFLCFKAQRRWAARLLDKCNHRVRRADGIIKDMKRYKSGQAGQGNYLYVILQFQAVRLDADQVSVRAQVRVSDVLWSRLCAGSIVEVAYMIDDENDFAIVADLEVILSSPCVGKDTLAGCCFLTLFAFIGIAIALGSWPLTGCGLGLAPFIFLVLGCASAGHALCLPLMRMFSQSCFFVTTSRGSTLSEELFGALETIDSFVIGRSTQSLQDQRQERDWLQLRATQLAQEAGHDP